MKMNINLFVKLLLSFCMERKINLRHKILIKTVFFRNKKIEFNLGPKTENFFVQQNDNCSVLFY